MRNNVYSLKFRVYYDRDMGSWLSCPIHRHATVRAEQCSRCCKSSIGLGDQARRLRPPISSFKGMPSSSKGFIGLILCRSIASPESKEPAYRCLSRRRHCRRSPLGRSGTPLKGCEYGPRFNSRLSSK